MGLKMKPRPLQTNVIIERQEEEKKTAGGIIIPDSNTEKPSRGKVLATGLECSSEVKEGDIVLFGKYSGMEFEEGDKKYLVMKEKELICGLS